MGHLGRDFKDLGRQESIDSVIYRFSACNQLLTWSRLKALFVRLIILLFHFVTISLILPAAAVCVFCEPSCLVNVSCVLLFIVSVFEQNIWWW